MKIISSFLVVVIISLVVAVFAISSGAVVLAQQGVPPIASQFSVMNMQIDDTTDQLDVIQHMYFDPINLRSKMTATGSLVNGFLEQIVRCDGPSSPSGYLLELTGPTTSADITACSNQSIQEEWSNFWQFPSNATYLGKEAPPKYTQKFDCYMYWTGGEQFKVYIDVRQNSTGGVSFNVPIWSGKVFTTVPGYHLYHSQWVNFVPGAPPVSDYAPTGSTSTCQQQQRSSQNQKSRVIKRHNDLFSRV